MPEFRLRFHDIATLFQPPAEVRTACPHTIAQGLQARVPLQRAHSGQARSSAQGVLLPAQVIEAHLHGVLTAAANRHVGAASRTDILKAVSKGTGAYRLIPAPRKPLLHITRHAAQHTGIVRQWASQAVWQQRARDSESYAPVRLLQVCPQAA